MCKSILDLDKNIFFVGTINGNGRLTDCQKAKQNYAESGKHGFEYDVHASKTIHVNARRS